MYGHSVNVYIKNGAKFKSTIREIKKKGKSRGSIVFYFYSKCLLTILFIVRSKIIKIN